MKTFEFRTLGCKVNQYESQALRERLFDSGLRESEGNLTDIYVVNTCAVTQKADKESFELIRQLNRRNPQAKIFVTGCSAQNNPGILKNLRGVACVLENDEKENLPDFILSGDEKPRFSLERPRITKFHQHTRAFLKIQDGCNNACSYCIIPKLRGASRSRLLSEIAAEARSLADNGYKEIVLCGICLGAYGKDLGPAEGLVKVIEALEKIDGLERIRLSSIEASDVSQELINKMRNSEKLCRHLHIPFQSGEDKLLKLMKRKTTSDDYRKLVLGLRKVFADIGITTDIMAGFPGEDEISFKQTIKFLKEVRPSRIHVFPFSPRQHTPAFGFGNRVNPQAVKARARQIKALAKELYFDFCRSNLGKTLNILLESSPEAKTGLYKGYSDNYLKVFLPRPSFNRNIPLEEGRGLPKAEHLTNTIVKVQAIKIYQDGILAALP